MRIRTIKPDFFKHDRLGTLPPLTRLLFVGLWCMADGEGRLEERPARIRVEILPYDDADVEVQLQALADGGHVVRYEVDGVKLIAIPSWHEHQRISGKEAQTPSRYPAPSCEGSGGEASEKLEMPRKGREGKGKDGAAAQPGGEPAGAASPPPPVAYPVFDCVPRNRTGQTWTLTDAHLAELAETFPGVDVPRECRKAWQWVRNNPAKRKTARGMPQFIFRWLERTQNRTGGPDRPVESPEDQGRRVAAMLNSRNGAHRR